MDKVARVGLAFLQAYRFNQDHADPTYRCSPSSRVRAPSAFAHPIVLKTPSSCNVLAVLSIATTYLSMISAQGVTTFSIEGTSYDCSSNIICLGHTHWYNGDTGSTGIQKGRLSFISDKFQSGIAYYKMPVKLRDDSTRQAASFTTSFIVDVRSYVPGDGMTFLISANNSYLGANGGLLGVFDNETNSTPFKSIVVELDTYKDDGFPEFDISGNHMSFDFNNITHVAIADANNTGVTLSDQLTKHVWVEYTAENHSFEARVAYDSTRPIAPLLKYQVDIFDYLEEYMWVGFSSSSAENFSNFYVGNWSFESYGIPPPPSVQGFLSSPVPSQITLIPTVPNPVPTAPSQSPTTAKRTRNKLVTTLTGILVGIAAFLVACLIVIVGFVLRRRSSRRGQPKLRGLTEGEPMQLDGMPERFTYEQLSVATRDFREDTKLGQGGFGSVYRGVLPSSGILVAVKKIDSDSIHGQKEFMAEVSTISQLSHRNLIQLQGWCKDASKGNYLLVYELMPNGSLDKVLFESAENQTACLSWAQRFNIVTGTASAVDYLHRGWRQQVIHRDIKSSNIMLDGEWNAKLGDFGLARLVDHEREAATTQVAGTVGYLAPEVATLRKFTEKTDVYAFGALLLEVACGRNALAFDVPEEEVLLVDWVWERLSEGKLMSTVDTRLESYDTYWMEVILKVGLLCSHPDPLARPCMRRVVQVLAGDLPAPLIPLSKPQLVFSRDVEEDVDLNRAKGNAVLVKSSNNASQSWDFSR